ncbi:MAG TPA: c-type cytochrome [Solirubrobacterales bacterium]|jgi:mono/diheme cytochrome c family protein
MFKLPNQLRLFPALAGVVALALVASGCGTSKADEERGRALFIQNCGTCHTLAQAGTNVRVGPDLDDAFAAARAAGETDSTIEGVVKAQVENPRPSTDNPAVSMPAEILVGQDLDDVAAYVGRWAGVPGAAPPKVPGGPGAQVFASNSCGGCHTLAAAEAGGTVGPNLDEVLVGMPPAMIEKSIVDPSAEIAKGYPANLMPATYGAEISQKELKQLIEFLIDSTAKGGGSK